MHVRLLIAYELDVSYNYLLDEIDLQYCESLKYLNCTANSLTELDISENHELECLFGGFNDFTILDLRYNPMLMDENIYVNDNVSIIR